MLGPKRYRKKNTENRRSSLVVNLSFESDNNKSDYDNISGKEEELDKNCSRLKEAILQKTRQIFDQQNDFCRRTATILEQPCSSNFNFDKYNQPNKIKIQENVEVNENNPGNSQDIKRKEPSPIVAGCYNKYNTTILLPRQYANCSNMSIDGPVMSSTFINDPCVTPKSIKKLKLHVNRKEKEKTTKPIIKNIRSCYIALDRIEELKKCDASKNLKQVSMELTQMQGNNIGENSNEYKDSNEKNSSLVVETSILDDNCSNNSSCQIIDNKNLESPKSSLKIKDSNENSIEIVQETPRSMRLNSLRSRLRLNSSKTSKDIEENKMIVNQITNKQLEDTIKLNISFSSKKKSNNY